MTERASILKGQGVALVAIAAALAGRFALDPFLGDHLPYVTFFMAVAFTTWYAGLASALTTTLLGGLAALWFFIPPRLSLDISDFSQRLGLVMYGVVSLTYIAFGQVMNREWQRAEELAQQRKRADDTLGESEARTRAIFESALDALITMDSEGRIQDFNPAAEQMFGYRETEAVGQTVAELLIPPHLRERHREGLRRYLETGEGMVLGRRIQMPALRADGTEIPVEFSIAVTQRPSMAPFFTAYVRDISERVRSERATAHLAAIVRSSDDAVISKDLTGTVMSWNQAAERLFGYRADEMIGQPVMKLIPQDRQAEEHSILEKIRRGETVDTYETIRRRKDGTDFHVSLTISPLFDAQGNVIGASKIARDITERVQHESVLAHSRERLRQALQYQEAIVSHMGEGLYTVNRQGLVVSMNQAAEKLFGWTKEELIGRKMHDLTHYKHPDGRPFPAEDCAGLQVLRNGVSLLNHEDVFIRKDGSFFNVVHSSSPIRSGEEITGLVVVFHDVTEQKRAENTLRDRDRALTAANDELTQQKAGLAEANKELQSFSYSVSHDLRAPLRTIDAYVRIVEEDHGPLLNDEVQRCLGIIRKAAGQAGELIDDLLEFSRLGRIGMDFRATKMTELARESAAELSLTQHQQTVDLTIGDLPLCSGDWRLLKLVWANLLSNAFKFTRGRPLPQIEVGWLPDDRQPDVCVYYVKDNGVGFDMKYVHKLFGVFQRLHLKDEFEGTGVGLAIVQRIVQRHGGRVWAEGKVDGGATFFFSLRKAM
jgi:PAS domain S-box-containing protein